MRDKLALLWPTSPDPDAALVATVAKIRRKLAGAGVETAIQTVRGLGYRLETAGLHARHQA
jgi:DNA-binding response OmpR family regulator